MSGQSYTCLVCDAYLGRGRKRLEEHQVPEACLRNLERSIAFQEERLADSKAALQDIRYCEDAGITDRGAIFTLLNDRARARQQAKLLKAMRR